MARKTQILSFSDYAVLAQFRHDLRQFLAFSELAAHDAGLTPAQHQALLAIKGMPGPRPVSVGALAQWLDIRPHSAVGLVQRLARLGLIDKGSDPSDNRRVTLHLTARADRVLQALSLAHRQELRRLSATLGSALAALR